MSAHKPKKAEPRKREPRFEPLVVTVADAKHLLSDSHSGIYRKMRDGRLKYFQDGKRRKPFLESIKALLTERPSS